MEAIHSWWQNNKQLLIIAIIIISVLLIAFALLVHWFGWDWTGLSGINGISIATDVATTPQKSTRTIVYQVYQPSKTLWDWLQLLGVPVVVGFGAVWFTARQNHDREIARMQYEADRELAERQHQADRELAADNQREATLQAYIDKISELLLKEHLGELTPDGKLPTEYEQIRNIAHVRTLAVLPTLDGKRKGTVLQFLYESNLINKKPPIISLFGADLREADLRGVFYTAFPWVIHGDIVDTRWENITAQYGANLSEAYLFGAVLNGANLSRVNLSRANLRSADLRNANLSDADLTEADLHEANLHKANLYDASLGDAELRDALLYDADLSKAYLRGAFVYADALSKAKSLDGATMPNGEIRDPGKSISSQL
jgi:uncharacterized protein YjbI with pentapeptide repeats